MAEYVKWIMYFDQLSQITSPTAEKDKPLDAESVLRSFGFGP